MFRRQLDDTLTKSGLLQPGELIGLMHDLGKYSRAFRDYLRRMALDQDTEQDSERGKIDHSTAGAQTIWRSLKPQGTVEGTVGEILAICVASHHSGLIGCITPSGNDKLSRRMKKADAESHFDEAWASAERCVVEDKTKCLGDPGLAGGVRDNIVQICRADQSKMIQRFKIGLLIRFLSSCLIDADRTDTADFSNGAAAALRQHGRCDPDSVSGRGRVDAQDEAGCAGVCGTKACDCRGRSRPRR